MSAANMLLRRLRILIDRTLLARVSYRGKVRVMQVESREDVAHDDLEHVEPYGFTSHPLIGAESIVACAGGNRGRAIVLLVSDRRHRIVIAEGETAIYTHDGDFVHIKNSGEIHVKAATKVLMETPLVEMSQDLLVKGNAHFEGNVVIDHNETVGGNHSVAGTSHGTGTISSDADVVAGSKSLSGHHHQEHDGPNTGAAI